MTSECYYCLRCLPAKCACEPMHVCLSRQGSVCPHHCEQPLGQAAVWRDRPSLTSVTKSFHIFILSWAGADAPHHVHACLATGTTTATVGREGVMGVVFTRPIYYDGQGFMVKDSLAVSTINELRALDKFCAVTDSTSLEVMCALQVLLPW